MAAGGLSLIIPVYNGERFIRSSIIEYNSVLSRKFSPFEIIVVCNACTDKTENICVNLKKESKISLKVLNVSRRGKGYALSEAFNHVHYEIIGFLDADNPFELTDVVKMVSILQEKNIEMVIASKFMKKRLKYQMSFSRRLFSLGGAIVSKFLFNLNFKDTQAGAKFMKKELIDKLKNNFRCGGFEFDMELLYRASKIHAKIMEYYVSPRESDSSTVKARILPGILYRLLKLRLLK